MFCKRLSDLIEQNVAAIVSTGKRNGMTLPPQDILHDTVKKELITSLKQSKKKWHWQKDETVIEFINNMAENTQKNRRHYYTYAGIMDKLDEVLTANTLDKYFFSDQSYKFYLYIVTKFQKNISCEQPYVGFFNPYLSAMVMCNVGQDGHSGLEGTYDLFPPSKNFWRTLSLGWYGFTFWRDIDNKSVDLNIYCGSSYNIMRPEQREVFIPIMEKCFLPAFNSIVINKYNPR